MHVKAAARASLVALLYGTLLLFAGSALAQGDKKITGSVKDEKGLPMAGASVSIKGTSKGTTTDSSGNFSITASETNSVLVIAFLGYETRQIGTAGGAVFNIQLAPDRNAHQLEDMVVVGYGTQRKVN